MSSDSDVTNAPSATIGAATYSALFAENANLLTVAGAVDDETGPVAYLGDLFTLSSRLEEGADPVKACLLAMRRPDLPDLALDNAALHRECSTLDLVNELLEKRIALCTGNSTSVQERMVGAATPVGLPYDAPWNRVLSILHLRGIPLWRAVRHADPEFPAFVATEKPSKGLRAAVTMGCGFAPAVRKMLIGPAVTTDASAVTLFSKKAGATLGELSAVKALMEAAGLKRRDVRHLLAVDGVANEADAATAVSLARYAPEGADKPSSKAYGAAFINAGAGPLWIKQRAGSTDAMDTEIAGLTATHLDRMQRLLQVRARLDVSFADADLLLRSALAAEKAAADALPTEQTLRAIGLYGHLKASTGITPDGFAALIGNLPVYAIGRTPALLDSLIKVTDKPFTADDTTAFATALRIDTTLLEQLLQRVEAVQKTRACTLSVISACYRLTSLPRLLGLSIEDGLAMLDLLEQQTSGYNAQIVGNPSITRSLDAFDILDVIPALWNAADWARQHHLSFIRLKALCEEAAPTTAPNAWLAALADAAQSLSIARLDTRTIDTLMRDSEGHYDLGGKAWSEILNELVDNNGLIFPAVQVMQSPALRTKLSELLTKLKKPDTVSPVEDHVSKLGNAIADTAASQDEVASQMLRTAFALDVAQAPAVLAWTGVSGYQLLSDAMTALNNRVAGNGDASTFSGDMTQRWYLVHRIASLVRLFDLSGTCLDSLVAHPEWFNLRISDGKPARSTRLDTLYRLSRYRDWAGTLATGFDETDALTYLERVHEKAPPAIDDAAAHLARLLGATTPDIRELSRNIGKKTVAGVAGDVADIDYVMRLLALQRELGISVATLKDLNDMKETPDAAQVKRVAAGLSTTLDASQRAALDSTLAEAWRDALCTWLLHFGSSQPVPLPAMVRPVDLSAYLLIDVEVGSEPRTTRVAAAIASLQQYIHRLYARLEDGYAWQERFVSERKAWRDWRSQFGSWQTYNVMKRQPSGFLDPSRRSSKSSLFEGFEKLVGQGKFAADEIQTALLTYLADFERVSNIQPLSAYHDGVDPQSDTFHFIGRSNVEPAEYYWRTLDMSIRDTRGAPSMLAWGEWQKITLPATGVIVQTPLNKEKNATFGDDPRASIDAVRPVVIAGRRYVVWLERDGTEMMFDDKPSEFYVYRLCYAYLQTDGQWSTANELIRLDGTDPAGRPERCGGKPDKTLMKTLNYQPRVVVMVDSSGPRKDDPWLVALLITRNTDVSWKKKKATYARNSDYYIAAKDLLLVETRDIDTEDPVGRPIEAKLVDRWSRMFDDPRVVQHRYVGAATIVRDELDGESQNVIAEKKLNKTPYDLGLVVTKVIVLDGNSRGYSASAYRTPKDIETFHIPFIHPDPDSTVTQIRVVYGIDRNMTLPPLPSQLPPPDTYGTKIWLAPSKPGHLELKRYSRAPGQKADVTFSDGSSRALSFKGWAGSFGHYSYEEAKRLLGAVSVYNQERMYSMGQWKWKFPLNGIAMADTLVRVVDSNSVELARFVCKAGDGASALTSEFFVERSKLNTPLDITVTLSRLEPGSEPYATRTARLAIVDLLADELQPDDGVPSIVMRCNTSRIHSLDFSEANRKAQEGSTLPPAAITLSTLFGKRLVALATDSVQRVLAWQTQTMEEPGATSDATPSPIDFGGCNGVYFWELFFHVPWLVAWRLRETRQFRLAEEWCTRHLFDPQRGLPDGGNGMSRYWNAVPLTLGGGALASQTYVQDPDALADFNYDHYRRATFLFLVELWLTEGDSFYRQMTRDALVEAWLCYEKALRLIGRLPEPLAPERWQVTELKSLSTEALHASPDRRIMQAQRNLVRRMDNLRHGLTLDGKPGLLPMYAGETSLNQLLNPRTGSSSQGRPSRTLTAPGFRYGEIMPRAREAVAWLTEMGKHLFHVYEAEFDADLAVMQHKNLIDLHRFTIDLQKNGLASARAEQVKLERGRDLLLQRKQHFEQLVDSGLYHNEAAGFVLGTAANIARTQAGVFGSTEQGTEIVPTIFGMAVGGAKPGSFIGAAKQIVVFAADILSHSAQAAFKAAEFDRRTAQWKFEIATAKAELSVCDREIAVQELAVTAAGLALEEARTKLRLMDEEYVFMTTGFAIGPTYHWMISHLTSIYSMAYDAVFALCLDAEAAYQRDTGDFTSEFVRPAAWSDKWKGMLAGESLQRDLLMVDSAYLRRNERRILVERDISLAGLKGGDDVQALRQGLSGKGFVFSLPSLLFDQDYPGHYLRQIQHVSVTLVLKGMDAIDSTCHVPALLTQISSTILTEADTEALERLYKPDTGAHDSLRTSVRANQQTAVSTRTADVLAADGYGVLASLLFGDGRLLPFEGTGAISTWRLELPGSKTGWETVLGEGASRLTDVIFRVKYTARDGGAAFAAAANARAKALGSKVLGRSPQASPVAKSQENPVVGSREDTREVPARERHAEIVDLTKISPPSSSASDPAEKANETDQTEASTGADFDNTLRRLILWLYGQSDTPWMPTDPMDGPSDEPTDDVVTFDYVLADDAQPMPSARQLGQFSGPLSVVVTGKAPYYHVKDSVSAWYTGYPDGRFLPRGTIEPLRTFTDEFDLDTSVPGSWKITGHRRSADPEVQAEWKRVERPVWA